MTTVGVDQPVYYLAIPPALIGPQEPIAAD